MRKGLLVLFAAMLIFSLCGCSEEPEASVNSVSVPVSPAPQEARTEAPVETEDHAVTEAQPSSAVSEEDEQAAQIYKDFLSENYDRIMEITFKSIAGLGFIDLDLDGIRELILFDAGASASMGVQLFDIVGGEVLCVSANVQGLAEAFGGADYSGLVVNANLMEDFRLKENKSTGERFFVVESKNGNVESSYSEYIRFENNNGVLALSSIFYKYEEYDTETNTVILQEFRVGDRAAGVAEYTSEVDRFNSDNVDMALECRGVFIWENNEYLESYKSFMDNVEKAMTLYEQNRAA